MHRLYSSTLIIIETQGINTYSGSFKYDKYDMSIVLTFFDKLNPGINLITEGV